MSLLNGSSSRWAHAAQNLTLVLLSVTLLPVDLTVLFSGYVLGSVQRLQIARKRNAVRASSSFRPRTILVTGVGMTKGLTLARLFHRAGHNVIGADFDSNACGSVSRSLDKFYRLQVPTAERGSSPYLQSLLEIILKGKVDLWVSCSGVASAVEDGEAKEIIENRTNCKAIQFDIKTTQMLHEKHSFIEHTQSIGLNVPETHYITSQKAAQDALGNAPQGRKFIMKPIGMDDSARGDMTLLPKATAEETSTHLDKLRISEKASFILQQFVKGDEYCTHSLVVRGKVKAFVACPSAELLMHYTALPADSALSQAMLRFTEEYAINGGESFTGHLSFDFFVEDRTPTEPKDIVLYPIECNPRAHTAVVLFSDTPSMVEGYLSLLQEDTIKEKHREVVFPYGPRQYYWAGHDLIASLLVPVLLSPVSEAFREVGKFFAHILTWRDGTFEAWDPLPWFWLYHVYWTLQFLSSLKNGKRWSRVNVSTTKMFEC